MKYFIECYYKDGSQILGNGDGQAVIHCQDYRRTKAYKRIVERVNNPASYMNGKVDHAMIVSESNRVLEIIRKKAIHQ